MSEPHNERIGQSFGRYRLASLLGRGGMAEVYLAHDPQLERDVAIKLMHPHLVESDDAQRFSREARMVAQLRHPNIVRVYEFDVANGRPYLVMEYVDGGTLKERLEQRAPQPLPLAEVTRIGAAIGSAIDYAHQKGLVHRDIKPSNILFMRADDVPVLADFGIAKLTGQNAQTASASVSGTPSYMAPEQARGVADARSDLYAFAVVLYEMLAGRTPFSAQTPVEMMLKHAQEPPPSPLRWRPDLPPAVDAVFARALSKDPDTRYQTAAELVNALQGALAGPRAAQSAYDAPTLRESPATAALMPQPAPAANFGARALAALSSLSFFVAPLIGRQHVQMKAETENRRELLASLMAMIGVLLAGMQLMAGTLDLVSRAFAPILKAPPLLIVALLALGAIATLNLRRVAASAQRRRRAGIMLALVGVGVLAWGGWTLYERLRPPAGPVVVIADFQACKTCDEIDFGPRIYRYVKRETDRLKLPDLEVRYVLESYADADTARARGAEHKATLVIWGTYDKAGVLPRFEILRSAQPLAQHLVQPEDLSLADFHLQNGDREVAFVSLLTLGLLRYAEGDYTTALALYDAGLQTLGDDGARTAPNAEVAYFYKALSQYASGDAWSRVVDNLKTVVSIRPKWADAHYMLGLAYLSACKPDGSNSYDLALAASAAAVELRADANSHWLRGHALAARRQWTEAAAAFVQSLRLQDDAGVRSELIDAYRKMGRADLAEQEAKRLIAVPSRRADEVSRLRDDGDQLYYQGRMTEATLRYQQAITRAVELKRSNTVLATLYASLGDAYAAQNQHEAAVENYRKAESLWGKNWSGYGALAQTYVRMGKTEEAVTAYQKALDVRPCDDEKHMQLAELYRLQGQNNLALDEYRRAAVADPTNGLPVLSSASLLTAEGKIAESREALLKAAPLLEEQLRQEPTNANIAYLLGSTYMLLNQYEPALRAFQKFAALRPDGADVHYWLGVSLYGLSRYAEAVGELERADKQKPNDVVTLSKLADAYRMAGQLDQASATYKRVIALDARDQSSWFYLAQIAEQQKNWEEAAKAYEALVGLRPKDPQAHSSLGFAYFNLNRAADALKSFESAAALDPHSGYFQTNLALALFVNEQPDRAISVAKHALELDETQIVAHYVLGLAYNSKGDRQRAISELQLVVQSPTATPDLKKAAEQILQQLRA